MINDLIKKRIEEKNVQKRDLDFRIMGLKRELNYMELDPNVNREDLIKKRLELRSLNEQHRDASKAMNKLRNTTRKNGTLLPFSPYRTPTLYNSRPALDARVKRGLEERKARLTAALGPLRQTQSYANKTKEINDTDLLYRDFASRDFPVSQLQITGRSSSRGSRRSGSRRSGSRRSGSRRSGSRRSGSRRSGSRRSGSRRFSSRMSY
jgi:hypothetical protein